MTVEEDVADLQARMTALEARATSTEGAVAVIQARLTKARLLLVSVWRKIVNRAPTQEEL